jgi:hypothetical protein
MNPDTGRAHPFPRQVIQEKVSSHRKRVLPAEMAPSPADLAASSIGSPCLPQKAPGFCFGERQVIVMGSSRVRTESRRPKRAHNMPRYCGPLPCVADLRHLPGLVVTDCEVTESMISLAE